MRLIANKPCSFGGRKFYIGDEILKNFVADAKLQEKMGVITIVNDSTGVSGGQSGTLFTQEQVERMIAEAVEEAGNGRAGRLGEQQECTAERKKTDLGVYDGVVQIAVKGTVDGQYTTIPARPEEIQQAFSIMQLNVEDGSRAIADVKSENVLILIHATDSRKTVKNAAKEQTDKLFSTEGVLNESTGGNETIGTDTGELIPNGKRCIHV